MPRVRACKSFIWKLRDVDVGDEFDVTEREAFLLIHGYQQAVAVDGPPPALPTAMLVDGDPAIEHRDPVRAKAPKRGRA